MIQITEFEVDNDEIIIIKVVTKNNEICYTKNDGSWYKMNSIEDYEKTTAENDVKTIHTLNNILENYLNNKYLENVINIIPENNLLNKETIK
jgi:hypothetical protein